MSQTINTVRVKVNSTPSVRVQTIQYAPGTLLAGLQDVEFASDLTGRGVVTYDQATQKFIIQDVPQLNGGTF